MRREQNRLLTFAALILVTLAIIVLGSRSGILRPLISVLIGPLGSLAGAITDGADSVADLSEEQPDLETLREQNRELERTVAELQVEIVRLREIERDYYRISDLLDYAANNPDQILVTGDTIARDTSGYLRWIIINRGARDGIQVGDPVINDLGLVGRVEDVAANAAWVLLANDPNSAINAVTQTSRAEGTVVGQLQGGLRMQYISREAVIEIGDLVVTSGLGGRFPANIVIGQVTSVRSQQAALFQEAEIRPIVDFNRLEIVSVITSFESVDPTVFDEVIEEQEESEP